MDIGGQDNDVGVEDVGVIEWIGGSLRALALDLGGVSEAPGDLAECFRRHQGMGDARRACGYADDFCHVRFLLLLKR